MLELILGAGAAYLCWYLYGDGYLSPGTVPSTDADKTKSALDVVSDADIHLDDASTKGVGGAIAAGGQVLASTLGVSTGALGGILTQGAGTLATAAGGTIATITTSQGLAAVLPVACLYFGVSLTAYLAFAFFVVVAVEVAYEIVENVIAPQNQRDALRAMEDKWQTIYRQTSTQLSLQYPGTNAWALERAATNFADGFVYQSNRLAYLKVLRAALTPGATVNALAEQLAVVNGVPQVFTLEQTRAHQKLVDLTYHMRNGDFFGTPHYAGEPASLTLSFSALTPNRDFNPRLGDLGFELTLSSPFDSLTVKWVPHGQRPEYINRLAKADLRVDTPAVPSTVITSGGMRFSVPAQPATYKDYIADDYAAAGMAACNACHFASHMSDPWGVGQNEVGSMVWGLDNGFYEGTLTPGNFAWNTLQGAVQTPIRGPASLHFLGGDFYWRTQDGKVNVCRRYDTAALALDDKLAKLKAAGF